MMGTANIDVINTQRFDFVISSAKWKNPYVTDGLVAMWDGEWNADGGVHDPNATMWKDLAGTSDISLMNLTFGNMSLIGVKSQSSYGTISNPPSSVVTIESCFQVNRTDYGAEVVPWSIIAISNKGFSASRYITYLRVTFVRSRNGYANLPGLSDTNSGLRHYTLVGDPTSDYMFYKDGVLQANTTVYGYINSVENNRVASNLSGQIYNIRLYSRALTADEIAANCAIDKARFNLP